MPKRICPICQRKFSERKCPKCQPKRRVEATRSSTALGYDYNWETRIRPMILERDPFCLWPGCSKPSDTVDHYVPKRPKVDDQPAGDDAPSNLWGLCKRHHGRKTYLEEKGQVYRPVRRRVVYGDPDTVHRFVIGTARSDDLVFIPGYPSIAATTRDMPDSFLIFSEQIIDFSIDLMAESVYDFDAWFSAPDAREAQSIADRLVRWVDIVTP